jgi:hypothetical protein
MAPRIEFYASPTEHGVWLSTDKRWRITEKTVHPNQIFWLDDLTPAPLVTDHVRRHVGDYNSLWEAHKAIQVILEEGKVCAASEGNSGVDCELLDGHAGDHEGTWDEEMGEGETRQIRTRWVRSKWDGPRVNPAKLTETIYPPAANTAVMRAVTATLTERFGFVQYSDVVALSGAVLDALKAEDMLNIPQHLSRSLADKQWDPSRSLADRQA